MTTPTKQKVIELFYGEKLNNGFGWKYKAERGLAEQHEEIKKDYCFYSHGVEDYEKRDTVKFNRVQPLVDPVIGFFIQIRGKAQYQAKIINSEASSLYSEYMNAVASYMRDNTNADHVESRQDADQLTVGIGFTDADILYENNPDGEYKKERVSPLETWWDPTATDTNILDSQYIFRRRKIDLNTAMNMLDAKEEDFEEASLGYEDGNIRSNVNGIFNRIGFEVDKVDLNLVNLYYLQWWSYENYWRMNNPLNDIENPFIRQQVIQAMNFIAKQQDDDNVVEDLFRFNAEADFLVVDQKIKGQIESILEQLNILPDFQKLKKKVYYTALLSGQKVFKLFRSADQQGFTLKAKTGTWDNSKKVWSGLVRNLREPSSYINKALTEEIRVIASNAKGGMIVEKGAIPAGGRSKFEKQMAKNDAVVYVEDGAVAGNKLTSKAQSALPTGFEKVRDGAETALNAATPVNAEFMGTSQNKQVSFALENQRIRQATTALAIYADAINLYQIEDARQLTSFVRVLAENNPSRLIKLVGQDGQVQFQQLLEDRFVDEYDIDIGDAPTTPTQKEEVQSIMLKIAQDLMVTTGQNIYPVALRYMNGIKESDKRDLIAALAPPQPTEEEQRAEEQRQAEIEALAKEGQVAGIQKTYAEAEDKLAAAAQKAAQTVKTEQEAEQTSLENTAIKSGFVRDTVLNI